MDEARQAEAAGVDALAVQASVAGGHWGTLTPAAPPPELPLTTLVHAISTTTRLALIGAGVLYILTIGSVKGFAYFLGLSTIVDLVLAWCYMHPLVSLMARRSTLVAHAGGGT